jgi:hypothetical protein
MMHSRRRTRHQSPVDVRIGLEAHLRDLLVAAPPAVVARVVSPGRGSIERVEALTPYAAQRIAEDVRTAGAGARLEITVRGPTPGTIGRVREVFAGLATRGIRVHVGAGPIAHVPTRRRPAA